MPRSLRILIGVLVGIVPAGVFSLWSFLSAGMGHGSYKPAMLFFPYAMVLTIFTNTISNPLIVLALLQYPLYGAAIASPTGTRKKLGVLLVIAVLHGLAITAGFMFGSSAFR
jgi:hypothetical protein